MGFPYFLASIVFLYFLIVFFLPDATCVYFGLVIYLCHVILRVYECLFVSIYSFRQIINPVTMIFNYANPIATALSIIADGPELSQQNGTPD